jgi:tetratricopeptide (TPR) repeat protein
MGFRFFRRIKLAPGVTLNLSKSGGSLSFGPRGAKVTIGPRGQRATVGIPGTGIFYTTTFGKRRARKGPEGKPPVPTPTVRQADRLTLGFFKRLITPDDHEALIDGWRELALGNEDAALARLHNAAHLADGAFLAGALALKLGKLTQAAEYLQAAAQKADELGQLFAHYGITATVSIEITEGVSAHIGPDIRGVLLALAETYQAQGRADEAIACLERLRQLEPEDVVVKLSLAELLWDSRSGSRDAYEEIVQLAEGVANESPVHTALLLYKAKALRASSLRDAAVAVLSQLLARKKGRPGELLRAMRYEQALLYEELGQERRARAEWEKLYAEAPDYEDVAHRLGAA